MVKVKGRESSRVRNRKGKEKNVKPTFRNLPKSDF